MKKILSVLAVLLFIGFVSANDCSTIYTRLSTLKTKLEQSNYEAKILIERYNYVNNQYEAAQLERDMTINENEWDKLIAESNVLQNELKRCESKDEEYKNYLAIWEKALAEQNDSAIYKPELLETAIYNYEKALAVANEANTTHMNISWVKEKLAFLKEYKAGRDKIAEKEANTKKEAEETAKKEEQAKQQKEVEDAKKALWNKAAIFESLVPLFKAKDSKTQENVKALLKTFTQSKDAYTRNIWIYFWYLVE